ncbi:MAG: zinc ribbon domain-containing protein [Pelagibacteraceae bacterium]|jgi:endogenous inhibitor of DNA gyrase (YacG/DUF329 family)|nr:zinc ribbon domain-containing protein [Pelagibacteraceae bacterium]MBT7555030.1 zinc ribbon domain-containing protein [Flavobacteriaceae bacterium]
MKKVTLIQCPTCDKEVSSSANNCPSCGAVLRKPKRSLFGKLIIIIFWVFNIIMAAWIFGGGGDAIQTTSTLSGAEQVGAVIGTGLAIGFLTTVWVIGAVIFGIMALLTRPK